MAKILVLHGPNLNLLGQRETTHYGQQTLNDINQQLQNHAPEHEINCIQSNAEHELIDIIHKAQLSNIDGIVFNPAAFTHTSIALRDALLAVGLPFIEVHLSNIYQRESFRSHSYFSDIALGVISGLGGDGYRFALQSLIQHIERP